MKGAHEKNQNYLKKLFSKICHLHLFVFKWQNCAYDLSDPQNEFTNSDDASKLISEEVCLDCLELWEAVQKVETIVTKNNFSKDIKYDI